MTIFDPGDIVLVNYPFTDLSASKKRPAIVISDSAYQLRLPDILLMPLTSQRSEPPFEIQSWQEAGLTKQTWAKAALGTFDRRILERKLGRLAATDIPAIRAAIRVAVADQWLQRG